MVRRHRKVLVTAANIPEALNHVVNGWIPEVFLSEFLSDAKGGIMGACA